jgi:hypothetical protein
MIKYKLKRSLSGMYKLYQILIKFIKSKFKCVIYNNATYKFYLLTRLKRLFYIVKIYLFLMTPWPNFYTILLVFKPT